MKLRAAVRDIREFLLAVVSRVVVTPLTWLVPRDPKAWVVLGRVDGRFMDNGKYFAAWVAKNAPPDVRITFVTMAPAVVRDLSGRHPRLGVARYPFPKAIWRMLRAGTLVYDAAATAGEGRIGFYTGARRVQLWHGTPLKEIELAQHRRRDALRPRPIVWLLQVHRAIVGRFVHHHLVICTSDFLARGVFAQSFKSDAIVGLGYPRNDVILGGDDYDAELIDNGVDVAARETIRAHREKGGKTLLYAPTFRDNGRHPTDDGSLDIARLSEFAARHNLLVVLKLHPFLAARMSHLSAPNVLQVSPVSDIYPLLSLFDVLLTDYSSIFFDYLLLNRPIVFYPYDLDSYRKGRALLFDYDAMTPGPRAFDFDGLLGVLEQALNGPDTHAAERQRVTDLVHDHRDGRSMQRLWEWLNPR
jgi:CDP-glycerol glycerophosphotransferase